MKRIFITLVALVGVSSCALADSNSDAQPAIQQITEVNKTLLYGLMNRNIPVVDKLIADDAILNDNGVKVSKKELKADFNRVFVEGDKTVIKNIKIVGVTVRGEVAVVVGRLWGTTANRGNHKDWINFTNVFVGHDKNWQLVSAYITPVKQ